MAWATAMLVGLFASGCGLVGSGSTGEADCPDRIKTDDVVFTSYGSTSHAATAYGQALEAVCEDTGTDAPGPVFTDESDTVTTYRLLGYQPSQVLAVPYGEDETDGFGVFFADPVSSEDRERILRELGPRER